MRRPEPGIAPPPRRRQLTASRLRNRQERLRSTEMAALGVWGGLREVERKQLLAERRG